MTTEVPSLSGVGGLDVYGVDKVKTSNGSFVDKSLLN